MHISRTCGIFTGDDSGGLDMIKQSPSLAAALALPLLSLMVPQAAQAQQTSVAETLTNLPCEETIYRRDAKPEMPVTSKSVPFNGRVYDKDRSQIVCQASPDYKGGALLKIGERLAIEDAIITIWSYDDPARVFQVELSGQPPRRSEILMDCKGYLGGKKPYVCDLFMDETRSGILRFISNEPNYFGVVFHLASYPGRNFNMRLTDIDTSQPVTVSGMGQTLPLAPAASEFGFAGEATRFQSELQASNDFFKALLQTKNASAEFVYSANATAAGGTNRRSLPVNIPRTRASGPLISAILDSMHRNEELRDP